MLKIEKTTFKEKSTEINIRQRMYKGKSFITLIVTTEFFPSLVGENLVSGMIEAKIDINDISCLEALVGKNYKGDIGSVTISVNNDGIWEHQSCDSFEFSISKRKGRDLSFSLKTDNCNLKTTGVMVSLYSTSSTKKELEKNFDLRDFYDKPIVKDIGKSQIMKYFVKE
ncbi:MAG: hypothetical protein IJ509_00975 [Bacilli bacterium]|nr:hypothetical protein [Bacilli bacterium]